MTGGADRGKEVNRPLRSSGRRVLPFAVLAAIAALYAATAMVQAPDTWIGLACGRQIAAHGVNDTDPFSFNSRPSASAALPSNAPWLARVAARWHPTGWINQNWLTHLILYEAVSVLGYDSLFALRVLVYLGVAALLWGTIRVQGAGAAAASLALLAAMATMRGYLEMRPQDFTNLLVGAELLILALAIRGKLRVLWALVPVIVLWCNLHGGFVFAFMMLAAFAAAAALGRRWPGRLAAPEAAWLRTTAAVAGVSLAGTVLLNPYHLSNLTHPLEVSVGPNAPLWQSVEEWRPIFEGGVATAEQVRFLVFLIVVVAAGAALLWSWQSGFAAPPPDGRKGARREQPKAGPALDLVMVFIAGLAVVMAIKSRRFIPIACICATPLVAQGLAAFGDLVGRVLPTSGRPDRWERSLALGAGALALALGALWGWRFIQVYVRPWPHAAGPASLFSRVTWDHRRGFDVCRFIRENGLEGRMYNIWVEGGTLEWCQQPDPATGRTPLQVFIDGRAQGAFPLSAMLRYLALEGGGPTGLTAGIDGRVMSREETVAAGAWLDARLKEEGVAVALIPEEDSTKPIMRGLLTRENWQVAFLAPYHVLFVNVDTPRGRAVAEGVFTGTTRFPDESSRHLTRAYNLFRKADLESARRALDDAIRAYSSRPAALAVQTARRAAAYPELAPSLDEFARGIVADYERNVERYLGENGFLERNGAAIVAAVYLRDAAREHGRAQEASSLDAAIERMDRARERVWGRAYW